MWQFIKAHWPPRGNTEAWRAPHVEVGDCYLPISPPQKYSISENRRIVFSKFRISYIAYIAGISNILGKVVCLYIHVQYTPGVFTSRLQNCIIRLKSVLSVAHRNKAVAKYHAILISYFTNLYGKIRIILQHSANLN